MKEWQEGGEQTPRDVDDVEVGGGRKCDVCGRIDTETVLTVIETEDHGRVQSAECVDCRAAESYRDSLRSRGHLS